MAFGWHMTVVDNWKRQRMLLDFVMRNKNAFYAQWSMPVLSRDLSVLGSYGKIFRLKEYEFTESFSWRMR